METHLADLLRRLAPWHGGRAQIWDYTVSHSVLRIKLSHDGQDPCAVLYMYDCHRLAFQTSWVDAALSVQVFGSGEATRHRIADGDRLSADCASVALTRVFDSYTQIPTDHFRSRANEPLTPLTGATLEKLNLLFFGEQQRVSAADLLLHHCGLGLLHTRDATPQDLERLRIAALRLSGGRMFDLHVAIHRAEVDWREVLVAAGFAGDPQGHLTWLPSAD
jgi:hypothetical protein